jgi:hypothetical protein
MRILDWIFSFFRKSVKKREYVSKRYENALDGDFTTIRKLMIGFDEAFSELKRLGRAASGVRALGLHLIGDNERTRVLSGRLDVGWSAYGATTQLSAFLVGSEWPIVSATKVKRVAGVEWPKEEHIYQVDLVYDSSGGVPIGYKCHVGVHKLSGKVRALRSRETMVQRIKCRGGFTYITNTRWDYPAIPKGESDSFGEAARELFIILYNMTMMRECGINIIARKGKSKITFTVPHDRWKYFFKDRIKVGRRHIFHSVMAHHRQTKNGVSNVRTHYRGLRKFKWNGYTISIVLPGKHAMAVADFNVAAVDPKRDDSPDMISTQEMQEMVEGLFDDNYEAEKPVARKKAA